MAKKKDKDVSERLTEMLDEQPEQVDEQPEQVEEQPEQVEEQAAEQPDTLEIDESLLIQDYRRVQSGEITEAGTIRRLASRFAAIANDSVAVQQASVDCAHAALQLYTYSSVLEKEV